VFPMREVSVEAKSSKDVGSCSGCTSFAASDGIIEHRVWVISLRRCEIRVCDDCRKRLIKELQREKIR
jgi:hypothetical protein